MRGFILMQSWSLWFWEVLRFCISNSPQVIPELLDHRDHTLNSTDSAHPGLNTSPLPPTNTHTHTHTHTHSLLIALSEPVSSSARQSDNQHLVHGEELELTGRLCLLHSKIKPHKMFKQGWGPVTLLPPRGHVTAWVLNQTD